jgi:hypothetical protein
MDCFILLYGVLNKILGHRQVLEEPEPVRCVNNTSKHACDHRREMNVTRHEGWCEELRAINSLELGVLVEE